MADSDEFDAFYRGTASRLHRYAYGLCTDVTEAEDLVQEAYARAWQRWPRLRGYEDAEAWLRLVVTRLATDSWRRIAVRRATTASHRAHPPTSPPNEDVVLLVGALRTFPLVQRRALTLHYLLDRSVADIAAETGASAGTVKSWLSRGRAALAEVLGVPNNDATLPTGGSDAR